MAWITDSLSSIFAGLNPLARGRVDALPTAFSHQIAIAAYMSSGMLRKVIAIPADDRVREWRDWQAEKEQITKLETEERRLGLQAKIKQAEILRGIGGGALILITAGNHTDELKPESIQEGGLIAVNVVSRWQINGTDWVKDLASPDYGKPAWFEIDADGRRQKIHPSRVVCFRGDPIPAGAAVPEEDAFWGDSRLLRVFKEAQNSDNAQAWFAALVKKAKLMRFGIPGLSDQLASPGGEARVTKRVGVIAEGENSLNAVVFDSGNSEGKGGEAITDYQINFAGIPAMMDAFDQRIAAVSDIPFTRLMGRSPAGMNATGEHDDNNWNKMVAAGQNLETRPCLEQVDAVMIRSAGVDPANVTWKFSPLWTPTEKEEADTFDKFMDAITKLQNTGTIPDVAMAKGVQNFMAEREYIPGLDQALAEIPEDERFGIVAEPDANELDPNAAEGGDPASTGSGGDPMEAVPPRRAANDTWFATDAQPKPLYVQRKLLNAADLIAWAKAQGFKSTLPAGDMHVTVLYSRQAVDPMKLGESWGGDADGNLTIKPGGPRAVEKLGDTAVVLLFASSELSWRHQSMVEAGGSHDFEEYQPHVTISYEVPEGMDLAAVKPFTGELRFGPELFEPLDLDWKSKLAEAE